MSCNNNSIAHNHYTIITITSFYIYFYVYNSCRYLQGKLDRLPALFRVLEPCRRASAQAIHETSIRNEHAYYQCIAQTLSYRLQVRTYVRYPLPLSMFRDMAISLYLYISILHKSQSVLSGVSERNYILSPHPTVALASHITIQHTNNYPLLNIHAVLRHLPFYRGFRNKRGISSASTFTQSPCCLL